MWLTYYTINLLMLYPPDFQPLAGRLPVLARHQHISNFANDVVDKSNSCQRIILLAHYGVFMRHTLGNLRSPKHIFLIVVFFYLIKMYVYLCNKFTYNIWEKYTLLFTMLFICMDRLYSVIYFWLSSDQFFYQNCISAISLLLDQLHSLVFWLNIL